MVSIPFTLDLRMSNNLVILLIILVFVLLIGMGKVGRHHLAMRIRKGGISFLKVAPSGAIDPVRLRWNGKYYEDGQRGVLFPLDILPDPEHEEKKRYNKILKQTAYYSDSHIPVVMGFEVASFVSNPQLLQVLEASKSEEEYSDYRETIEGLVDLLKEKTSELAFIQPFDVSTLVEYVESSTSASQRTTYEEGKMSGKFEMTQPSKMSMKKLAIPIGIVILLLLLAPTIIQRFMPMLKKFGILK